MKLCRVLTTPDVSYLCISYLSSKQDFEMFFLVRLSSLLPFLGDYYFITMAFQNLSARLLLDIRIAVA